MTRPNCEALAEENLRRQGFDCYLPRFVLRRPNKKAQVRPLFPRYIFVYIKDVWWCLMGTRGISRVLLGDGGPQPIPAAVIDNLRERENKKGFIDLEPRPKFLPGDQVKAKDGPLAGYALIYEGMSAHERVSVLVDIMGRQVHTVLDEQVLVAA